MLIHGITTFLVERSKLTPNEGMVATGPDDVFRCLRRRRDCRAGPLARWKATLPISCRNEPETLHVGSHASSVIVLAASGLEKNCSEEPSERSVVFQGMWLTREFDGRNAAINPIWARSTESGVSPRT